MNLQCTISKFKFISITLKNYSSKEKIKYFRSTKNIRSTIRKTTENRTYSYNRGPNNQWSLPQQPISSSPPLHHIFCLIQQVVKTSHETLPIKRKIFTSSRFQHKTLASIFGVKVANFALTKASRLLNKYTCLTSADRIPFSNT